MRTAPLIDGGLVGSVLRFDQNGNPIDPDDPIFAHAGDLDGVYISRSPIITPARRSVRQAPRDDVLRCMTNAST